MTLLSKKLRLKKLLKNLRRPNQMITNRALKLRNQPREKVMKKSMRMMKRKQVKQRRNLLFQNISKVQWKRRKNKLMFKFKVKIRMNQKNQNPRKTKKVDIFDAKNHDKEAQDSEEEDEEEIEKNPAQKPVKSKKETKK